MMLLLLHPESRIQRRELFGHDEGPTTIPARREQPYDMVSQQMYNIDDTSSA